MRLSFDDTESFKEAAGSLCFNNSPSDSNTSGMLPQIGPPRPGDQWRYLKIWYSSELLYSIREHNDTQLTSTWI